MPFLRATLFLDFPGFAVCLVLQFAAGAKSWIAINGGYFGSSGSTTASFSMVADQGVVLAPNIGALNRSGVTFYPTRSAFGLLRDGTPDVAWIYDVAGVTYAYPDPSPNKQGQPQPQPSATFPANGAPWPLWNAIGGGPVLIHNGSVRITWEQDGESRRRRRFDAGQRQFCRFVFRRANSCACQSWTGIASGVAARSFHKSSANCNFSVGLKSNSEIEFMFVSPLAEVEDCIIEVQSLEKLQRRQELFLRGDRTRVCFECALFLSTNGANF